MIRGALLKCDWVDHFTRVALLKCDWVDHLTRGGSAKV